MLTKRIGIMIKKMIHRITVLYTNVTSSASPDGAKTESKLKSPAVIDMIFSIEFAAG